MTKFNIKNNNLYIIYSCVLVIIFVFYYTFNINEGLNTQNVCRSDVNNGVCNPITYNSCTGIGHANGNVVVYQGYNYYWQSYTTGKGTAPYTLVMQSDGNLVMYASGGVAIWMTGTNGLGVGPYTASIENNGNFVVKDSTSKILWQTNYLNDYC